MKVSACIFALLILFSCSLLFASDTLDVALLHFEVQTESPSSPPETTAFHISIDTLTLYLSELGMMAEPFGRSNLSKLYYNPPGRVVWKVDSVCNCSRLNLDSIQVYREYKLRRYLAYAVDYFMDEQVADSVLAKIKPYVADMQRQLDAMASDSSMFSPFFEPAKVDTTGKSDTINGYGANEVLVEIKSRREWLFFSENFTKEFWLADPDALSFDIAWYKKCSDVIAFLVSPIEGSDITKVDESFPVRVITKYSSWTGEVNRQFDLIRIEHKLIPRQFMLAPECRTILNYLDSIPIEDMRKWTRISLDSIMIQRKK